MIYWILPLGIALVFYLLIPLGGSVAVIRRWRRFRRILIESSFYPLADYRTLRTAESGTKFRFFGRLEALEGTRYLWLRHADGSASVKVDMKGQRLWFLPEEGGSLRDLYPGVDDWKVSPPPESMPWSQCTAMTEGTSFFISGSLAEENGQKLFQPAPGEDLLVLQYGCAPQDLLIQTLWCARQTNEYWNTLAPLSLALGILLLALLGLLWGDVPFLRVNTALAFSLALVPMTAFLPPGIFFFRLFNRQWGISRWFRAYRDLVMLPFRYWGQIPQSLDIAHQASLPWGEILSSRGVPADWNPGTADYLLFRWSEVQEKSQVYIEGTRTDPFCNPVLFRGDPREFRAKAVKKARTGEFLAFGYLAAGAATNLLLLFLVFYRLLP